MSGAPRGGSAGEGDTVVLLAGPGDTTDLVANYLAARVPRLVVVVEQPPSRATLARRRAARLGWPAVTGQVLFVTAAMPLLRRSGRRRIAEIVATSGLDPSPYRPVHPVESVNAPETVELLEEIRPAVVVVNGTRIIGRRVLESVDCPFVNTHAGVTPRYRGVHGGYWALAEGRPELVGTTVHLVDRGIDTGGVLAQATFTVSHEDSIATYPYLHLAAGLPLLAEQVAAVLATGSPAPGADGALADGSRLYHHPTLWAYLARRAARGVR